MWREDGFVWENDDDVGIPLTQFPLLYISAWPLDGVVISTSDKSSNVWATVLPPDDPPAIFLNIPALIILLLTVSVKLFVWPFKTK